MKFVGKGQPLTRAGLNKALALLGLGVNDAAYIWTVVEVELPDSPKDLAFASIAGRKFSSSVICLENIRMAASMARPRTSPGRRAGMVYSLNNTPNWKKRSRFVPRRARFRASA